MDYVDLVDLAASSIALIVSGDGCRVRPHSLYLYMYIQGVPGRNVPDFGRMFLKLKYTNRTQNLYPKLNGYGDNGERSLKV